MPQTKYKIYELSARAVLSYAAEEKGGYSFCLSAPATEKRKVPTAHHEQDGNALFFKPCAPSGARTTKSLPMKKPSPNYLT